MVRYAQRANVRIKGERWIETPAGSLFLNGSISSAAWARKLLRRTVVLSEDHPYLFPPWCLTRVLNTMYST